MNPAIIWFRQDLRLNDNPALCEAVNSNKPLIFLYILEEDDSIRLMGGASLWWLHYSLDSLATDLKKNYNASLILQKGSSKKILDDMIEQTKADAIYWNRCYEPYRIKRDKSLKEYFKSKDIEVKSCNGSLLFEPPKIENKTGGVYKVFTPFWKHCLANEASKIEQPLSKPETIYLYDNTIKSDSLNEWNLLPTKPDWAGGMRDAWKIGEDAAHKRLEHFFKNGLEHYADGRNLPYKDYTSMMSPYLHFGEISPRQIWHKTYIAAEQNSEISQKAIDVYLSEIGWREFSYYLLYHFPEITHKNFKEQFDKFEWHNKKEHLIAWQKGQTGIPIVDAGMRQLWQTGWLHNRVRMIVASYLIKHCMTDWRQGEEWFWDTLVDADLASNVASWQWVAGSGADAAPYFRIFNPILQGEKFDPEGDYVKTYVPELAKVPKNYIHRVWDADGLTLAQAGITLGKTYPYPIVDLEKGREQALQAYEKLK